MVNRETIILSISLIALGIGIVFTEGRLQTTLWLFWFVLLVISFATFVGLFSAE